MDKDKVFITYRGELDSRFDCNFYLPVFKKNLNILKSNEYERLGNLVSFSNETWNQKDFFKEIFPYIEIGEVNLEYGEIENIKSVLVNEAPSRAKKIVRENDIIVSTTRPDRGAIIMINKKYDGSICSTGFAVLRNMINRDVTKEYLAIILRQDFILIQMAQRSSGGNYPAISEDELKNIVIPISNNQKSISNCFKIANLLKLENRQKSSDILANFDTYLSKNEILIPRYFIKSPFITHLLKLQNALNVERYAFTYELANSGDWQTIKEVGEVGNVTLTPSDEFNAAKPFTLLRIDDLPNIPFEAVSRTVTGSQVEGNLQHINTDDVLVSRLAPTIRNKKIIVAPKSDVSIIGSNEFIRLTCNAANNPIFVCYLLRTEFYTELMLSKSRGSTPSRYRLSRADFEKLPFPKVPRKVQDEIAAEYLKNIKEAQRLIAEGKEAVKQAKLEVEQMILGE